MVLFLERPDHPRERCNPKRMVVETRDLGKGFATGSEKGFAAAHADLFDGLEAIDGERGANDEEIVDALRGEFLEFALGRGREPGIAAES